jgi:hypothetical protein
LRPARGLATENEVYGIFTLSNFHILDCLRKKKKMATISEQSYGKARVRFVRVDKNGPKHTFREFEGRVLLSGAAFEDTYK